MPSIFGNKKQAPEAVVDKVDPATGQVLSITPIIEITVPNMETVTDISAVAGANPEMLNFRDHPEWNGMKFLVMRVRLQNGIIDGRTTDYALIDGFIYPPSQKQPTQDQRVLIATGSDNIYQRVVQAYAAEALPIVGTLRFAGRARFLD